MKSFVFGGVAGACLTLAGLALTGAIPLLSQTIRTAQFENATVKVWKTAVAPGSPTAMHRHDHPRIVVALTDGTMAFVGSDGKREEARWEAGKAYWLPAMPPGAMHSDVNAGVKLLQVMVIELEKE